MICRDVAITEISFILEDIYNNIKLERIKQRCERFKLICTNYEELALAKEEIQKDRLKEYIKFFNISGICEYDIFANIQIFYEALEENLEESEWKKIKEFLDSGNILAFYE